MGKEARLALAFYREAMGLEHPAYQFLSFYKIINLRYRKGAQQLKWIDRTLATLTDIDARKRMSELKSTLTGETIESYLYGSCRCAIAHASIAETTVDPEDPSDLRRISSDLPLIRALAVEMIRTEWGVPTQSDVYKKKVYALEGLWWVLGDAEVERIVSGAHDGNVLNMPARINFRTWSHKQLATFANIQVEVKGIKDGAIFCELIAECGTAGLLMAFDFQNNALVFEPLADILTGDDNSSGAVAAGIDALTLRWEFLLNGLAEVWSTDDGICLARSDAYLPVNIFVNPKGHEAEMDGMRKLFEERLAAERAQTSQQG